MTTGRRLSRYSRQISDLLHEARELASVPVTQPGTGYVLLDGLREPVRVRAAQATDADIGDLASTYPAPASIERTSDAEIAAALRDWST